MTSSREPAHEPQPLDPALTDGMAEMFKFVSNPVRLRILLLLQAGECPVSTIEKVTGTHQPTLSQQLSLLRESGVITARREQKSVFYTVTDRRMIRLLQWVALNHEAVPAPRNETKPSPSRANDMAAVFVQIGEAI